MRLLRISCMQGKGFPEYEGQDMAPADNAVSSAEDAFKQPAGPWGYLGAETAAQRGFLNSVVRKKTLTPVNLPEATLAASRECFTQASDKLTRPAAGADLVQRLKEEASAYTERDTRVVAARDKWRDCMKQTGFQVSGPQQLVDKEWRAGADAGPSPDEIATAVADEKCTQQSGLAMIYFPVQWGYQRELIDQNLQALTEYQTQFRARLAEVSRIAANGAS